MIYSSLIDQRSMALECLGIFCLVDEKTARYFISTFENSLDVDLKAVKVSLY